MLRKFITEIGLEEWSSIAKLCQKILVELFDSKLVIINCICITFYSNDLKYHQSMLQVIEDNNAVNSYNSSLKYQKLLKTTSLFR